MKEVINDEILKHESNNISELMEYAKLEESRRNFAKSEYYYNEILKMQELTDFKKEETIYNLAYIEYVLKKYDNSISHFNDLLNTRFRCISLQYLIKIYLDLNNYEEAKNQIKKYIDSKGAVDLLFVQGRNELKNENFAKAKFYFENLLEHNPSDCDLIYELAKLEKRQNNMDEAIYYYEKVLKYEDNSIHNLLEIARLEEEHDIDKAKYYYNKILKVKPNDLYSIYRLKKMGTKFEDNNCYSKKYDEISSERPEIICALDQINRYRNTHVLWLLFKDYADIFCDNVNYNNLYFKMGKSMITSGNYELARLFFDKCLNEKNGKNSCVLLELGKLETKQGEFEKAKYYFNLANRINNNCGLSDLGMIEACEGNYELARYYFNNINNKLHSSIQLLNLDIKEEKYEEAYKSCIELDKSLNVKRRNLNEDYNIYLKYKLGIFNWDRDTNYNYFANQLLDYNDDLTLKHIEPHRISKDACNKYNGFVDKVNLKELLNFAKVKITYLNPIEISLIDKYIIECDDFVSKFSGKDTKYLEAVTLPNSNKILTLYPILTCKKELIK